MGEEDVLRELLGDRAAALHQPPGAQIDDHGACQADHVDAEMAIEAAILGRQQGAHEMRRQLFELDGAGIKIARRGQDLAVGTHEREAGAPVETRDRADIGQPQRVPGENRGAGDARPEHQHQHPFRHPPRPATAWRWIARAPAARLVGRAGAFASGPEMRLDARRRTARRSLFRHGPRS